MIAAMSSTSSDGSEHGWTFLSNYAHVLVCIARNPDVTLREVAAQVGITERAVVRIIGELENAGVVTRVREGRRNHYEVDATTRLRHPLEADKTIGDLLSALIPRRDLAALKAVKRGRSRTS